MNVSMVGCSRRLPGALAAGLVGLSMMIGGGDAFCFARAPGGAALGPASRAWPAVCRTARVRPPAAAAFTMGPLDGWIAAAKYRETCPPQSCVEQLLLDQIRKQDFDPAVLHWAHPATMMLLVAPSMAYATYLGWKIRTSESAPSSAMSGSERRSAGSTHAVLMSAAALFSVFGIQGGVGSLLLANQPILESPHAASGFAFALLLGLQVYRALLGRPRRSLASETPVCTYVCVWYVCMYEGMIL